MPIFRPAGGSLCAPGGNIKNNHPREVPRCNRITKHSPTVNRKEKEMKKLFAILMSIMMIACFMPSMAFAAGETASVSDVTVSG